MNVHRILSFHPNFKQSETKNKNANSTNTVSVTGASALGFLGATVVTGIMHAKILHLTSAMLSVGCALSHVQSLNNAYNKHDYIA